MDGGGRVASQGLQVELLDQVQLLEKYVAAGVGRRFVNYVTPVGGGDRFLPAAVAIGHIFHGQNSALILAECYDSPRDGSFIEGLSTAVGHGLESSGEVLLVKYLPWT